MEIPLGNAAIVYGWIMGQDEGNGTNATVDLRKALEKQLDVPSQGLDAILPITLPWLHWAMVAGWLTSFGLYSDDEDVHEGPESVIAEFADDVAELVGFGQ
jgi:hypothetical protein